MEQRTEEWFLARKGKFTSSEIYNLLTTSRKKGEVFGDTALTYIRDKVTESVMADDMFIDGLGLNFSNMATQWGERYEADARELYMERTGEVIEETGFVPYTKLSGGSPDGVNADGRGLIEIKCPFNPSRHIDFMLMDGQDDLCSISKQYYTQCQANLLFCEREYMDFISFDPRMSETLKMRIMRIVRDEEAIGRLKERLAMAEERYTMMLEDVIRKGIEQIRNIKG